MSAQIQVPQDRWTEPLLRFVAASPLAGCTTVGFDGGARVVRTDRNILTLSTSEKHLWDLLASLTSGDLRALLNHADLGTLGALSVLFESYWLGAAA